MKRIQVKLIIISLVRVHTKQKHTRKQTRLKTVHSTRNVHTYKQANNVVCVLGEWGGGRLCVRLRMWGGGGGE